MGMFFEITKEGRKLMREIFRRIDEEETLFSEGLCHCLVRKCDTHENPEDIVEERKR